MLIQKGANVNVSIDLSWKNLAKSSNDSGIFKYLPRHYEVTESLREVSLFKILVQNDWLGVTFVAMEQMDKFGMSYAKLIEVAFRLKKLQFAKRLIEKQVSPSRLREKVTANRNLITSLAYENANESQDKLLLCDVIGLLCEAGVEPLEADDYGCTALHYACLHRNMDLFEYLKDGNLKLYYNAKDKFGRIPYSCLFWKCQTAACPNPGLVKELIEIGSDVDYRVRLKPLSHFKQGFTNQPIDFLDGPSENSVEVTPLIVCIVFRYVPLIELLLEMKADVNARDSNGMTPLMHAVKINDMDIVNLLVIHGAEAALKDVNGFTAFHHAITNFGEGYTHDNESMMSILVGVDLGYSRLNARILYKLSVDAGAIKIANYISRRFSLGCKMAEKSVYQPFAVSEQFFGIKDYDVTTDAQAMLKQLEEDTMEVDDGEVNDQDLPPSQCNVTDGVLHKNYSVVMTKIDVSEGPWGKYNFYRMQIWKEKHKELFVLFTNWGRIGDCWGQHQNTPFGSAEQAVQEFEKIFKAKSGNEWTAAAGSEFVIKKDKYRLVDVDKFRQVKKAALVFDLSSDKPSKLPEQLQLMMKDLANVAMHEKAYNNMGIDHNVVPFGRIKRDNLKRAQELLNELGQLSKENVRIRDKRYHGFRMAGEHYDVLSKIDNLSSEYYYLVPKRGFDFTQVQPLDSLGIVRAEMDLVERLLDFEVTERILLGAQFRKHEINPIDYIFRAIGCSIESIPWNDKEIAPHVLKYIYRSRGLAAKDVSAIYKVSIKADQHKLLAKEGMWRTAKAMNRSLLWHGTQPENLMSILTKGLIVNHSVAHGRLFGQGIYMADVLDKSKSYSHSRYYGRSYDEKYLLLCDVGLGKILKVTEHQNHDDFMKNYDSLHVVGLHQPNPTENVRLSNQGVVVPSGKIMPVREKSLMDYNEYVAFRSDQVAIRYIVRFADINDDNVD